MNQSFEKRVNNEVAEAVVIGGMVLDINATPYILANPRTTTPGKILYALGGVARNVAECMSKLGTKPYMISAVGLDMAGTMLLENWKSAGLSVEGIRMEQDINTASVCNIFDGKGELAAAVASVEAIETYLTPDWIQNFKKNVCSAPIMIVDANLSPSSLETSCQIAAECNTPVWFEPVSVAKSRRVASVAKYINFVSPNEDELIAMANALHGENIFSPVHLNLPVDSLFQKLKQAILVLLNKGIQVVIVTVGSNGVFLCCKSNPTFHKLTNPNTFSRQLYKNVNLTCPVNRNLNISGTKLLAVHFPAVTAKVVRLTGAGDCLVGGTVASLCAGLDIMQSIAVGISAAKGAVQSEMNVPEEYNLTTIADDARSVYMKAKVIFNQSML